MTMSNSLFLNKEIYCPQYIEMAVQAYRSIATVKIVSDKGYWVCVFEDCVYDNETTKREFENYVIALVNRGIGNADM